MQDTEAQLERDMNRAGIGTAAARRRPARLSLDSARAAEIPQQHASFPSHATTPMKRHSIVPSGRGIPAFPEGLPTQDSLASFKAAHAPIASSSQDGSASETHRTSSNDDIDPGFDLGLFPAPEATQLKERHIYEAEPAAWLVEQGRVADWIGIDMAPSSDESHVTADSELFRSSSDESDEARRRRAPSAVNLRAQFRAGEIAATLAQLTGGVDRDATASAKGGAETEFSQRRADIREGKRPVEGERALPNTVPLGNAPYFDAPKGSPPVDDCNDEHRNGHVVLVPDMSPPRSAPPQFSASFASQQERARVRRMSVEARASKVYPLPLRLLQRNKFEEETPVTLGVDRRAFGIATAESDLDAASAGPSPLFESEWEGTARTAPSTPNDTPILKGTFEDDLDVGKPVPHWLGASASLGAGRPDVEATAVGLGFDFGATASQPSVAASHEQDRDHFPLVPLRGKNRRISLPPVAPRHPATHRLVPSVSIIPPPVADAAVWAEEPPMGTSSSTLSQDSLADSITSPTRRVARRLSAVRDSPTSTRAVNLSADGAQEVAGAVSPAAAPSNRPASANVRTPQHLLVTPTPARFLNIRSPSFSFSPAPLRLVKVQLMRAAGYGPSPAEAIAPPNEAAHTAVAMQGIAKADKTAHKSAWSSFSDFVTSSPVARLDEVVPAKLILFAGVFLGPWCWLIGGWYLRSSDGEFRSTRGQRCREPDCGCGRIMRGSALRDHPAIVAAKNDRTVRVGEERFAGWDKWIFYNRVAAGTSGAVVTAVVIVAIWAAATA
ncbi:hypothetical protein JCM3774_000207 [Rhodotorula dairenensis]